MTTADGHSAYAIRKEVDLAFDDAVVRTEAALQAQGFGVLTTVDVKTTLRTKLGVEVPSQLILGACNPKLAHRALGEEPDLGLLLPCNVVIREDAGRVLVSAVDPARMLGVVENPSPEPRLPRTGATRLDEPGRGSQHRWPLSEVSWRLPGCSRRSRG
jgi:uncharacterized protein (DUF302 family)